MRKEYEAIEYFLKALELDPYYAFTYRELGLTYARIGEFKKALKCAEKYATISPGDADPFDALGEIYFRMGKLDDAIAKYKEAIEVNPDFFRSLRKLSYALALSEDYGEAIKWIDKYITIVSSPWKKEQGYHWRGWFYYMQGNFQQFNRDFYKAMKLLQEAGHDSTWTTIFVNFCKAWFYFDYGKLEAGKTSYQRWIDHILESGSEHNKLIFGAKWLLYQGFLDLRSEQFDSANARLVEAKSLIADLKPTFASKVLQYQYHLLHTEILLAQDSVQQAIAICKNIPTVKLRYVGIGQLTHYNYPLEKDVLARAYRKKGDLDKAISEYERLITIDQHDTDRRLVYPKYHYRLAKLYEEKGQLEKAKKEYEKFLTIWKDADKDLPELIDTKKRLKMLKFEK